MRDVDDDAPLTPEPSPGADWAVDSPVDGGGARCPWCSAPLPDATADRCGACGAQLAGAPETPIPGVTTVALPTVRPVSSAKASQRRSVLAWITGDEDLVAAARMPRQPASPSADTPAPGLPDAGVPLGPASADALTPPGARLRLEMLRVQLEAEGIRVHDVVPSAQGDEADADATDAADDTAAGSPALGDEAPAAGPAPAHAHDAAAGDDGAADDTAAGDEGADPPVAS